MVKLFLSGMANCTLPVRPATNGEIWSQVPK